MVFGPKQLENLEQLSDSRNELGCGEEQVGVDKDPIDPLVWRLKLIERAAIRVKKLHKAKLDMQASYQVGELVFDDKTKRFARVQSTCLKSLSLTFLSGGQGNYKVSSRIRGSKKLPSVVRSLPSLPSVSVKPIQKLPSQITAVTVAKSKPVQKAQSRVKKTSKKLFTASGNKKAVVAKKIVAAQNTSFALASVKQRDDYIRAHYLKMGNKELARHTGLSEHTIRRKLGEWSLRRPTT